MRFIASLTVALFATGLIRAERIASPDRTLSLEFLLTEDGSPRYELKRSGAVVLQPSKLGLVRDDADFSRGLKRIGASAVEPVRDEYDVLTAKRRHNVYSANRQVIHLEASTGAKLDLEFQVSNDGAAFRYVFPERSAEVRHVREEVSSFHFAADTRAWLQPMSVAKTGWSQVNPCYEEFYQKNIPVGTPSPLAGWVFPALFRTGETWVALTEGALDRHYSGCRLRAASPDGEYTIGFPDARENFNDGAVTPESTLPWTTPWRIAVVGSLKTVTESMLGLDLAPAADPRVVEGLRGEPTVGKASWSWPLLGDGKTTFDVQKRFIDYAADMHWSYCLIDALWDQQIGYDKVKELADYGRTKNVRLLLWYNSAGSWNKAPQTPRDRLLTHESRVAEFKRLHEFGIAGVKIDFFGGDGQSMIGYYHDIIEDAAPFGLRLNFHGATLLRGWERTYPSIMTAEAIKGFEYVTFEQKNADEEPTHAAMLPFTRNLFDPMDFTPMALDRVNGRIQRRTTSGFELALSVLFVSGIQHYAEIPEGMAKAPEYVRDFLRHVPSVWDDTKFLDGFPGERVVLARRGEGRWYLAGINATAEPKRVTLDLRELGLRRGARAELIRDGAGGNLSFVREERTLDVPALEVEIAPRGGFVLVVQPTLPSGRP
jgi:hypothetical protein